MRHIGVLGGFADNDPEMKARLTYMPGRIKIVLSQFDDLGATK